MNGDGLVDIAFVKRGYIQYWPGRGNGRWGDGSLTSCNPGAVQAVKPILMQQAPWSALDMQSAQFGDLNGDGLTDVAVVRSGSASIWLNIDGQRWTDEYVLRGLPAQGTTRPVQIADINGSGTPDIIWGEAGRYQYMDLLGGNRPQLLTRVANGIGKTTTIEYGTSTREMLQAGGQWKSKIPIVAHVVKRVTIRDNLGIIKRPDGVYVTEYEYSDPVYESRQKEFRGFRIARERRIGDNAGLTSVTESRFLLGECQEDGSSNACSVESQWVDNPQEALKGLPVSGDTYSIGGIGVSTNHYTYGLRQLYLGLDGRGVRYAHAKRTDSYVYDTNPDQWDGKPSSVALPEVEIEDSSGAVSSVLSGNLRLLAASGRVHLASATVTDSFGNATDSIAYGCVEGCTSPDETIRQHAGPGLVPDDASGWLWRTKEIYTVGANGEKRHYTTTGYDAVGRPISVTAKLSGTLPLDRHHEQEVASVAPPPTDASRDGILTLSTAKYDAFGNLVRQIGANGRCSEVEPDSVYGQLIVRDTVYVGDIKDGCGTRPLSQSAEYDRGFTATTTAHGYNQELSQADYDEMGRVVQVWKPHPFLPGMHGAFPDVVNTYSITSQWESAPYSSVRTQTQDGVTGDVPSYQESLVFLDGLGRTIISLSEADPAAGDDGPWIVSDAKEYDAKGLIKRAYRSWYWGKDYPGFPLFIPPPSKFQQQEYDAFGRPTTAFGLDGAPALKIVYHALSQDTWDAADFGQGDHAATPASTQLDGHGRTVQRTERIRVQGKLEERHIKTDYLPTGEPYRISRYRAGSAAVSRWIRYDSLGRMVLNADPNASKNFVADPSTVDASAMKTWRYAYNDAGQLVGTSDARGCGSNYFYEAGGRILAEDYSPCRAVHAAYSPPDLGTGDGTEAFYRYDDADPDGPAQDTTECTVNPLFLAGRLVSVASRGSKTQASYDGLGHVNCGLRRMAKPGPTSSLLAERYAPRWYAQTTLYDGAGRPVRESTGARVAENQGAAFESAVTTQYSARGIAKSVDSTHGTLISSTIVDANGLPQEITYGDIAKTQTAFSYDERERVKTVQTYRGPPALWTSGSENYHPPASGLPDTLQLHLEDSEFIYDEVDNPKEILDHRVADEWPAGAKPVNRSIGYDDLYRVTKTQYTYPGGEDSWVSPFDSENKDNSLPSRRAKPSPHSGFANRVREQHFDYDWLGNTILTTDDANGFYDRSLGKIQNGDTNAGPYQIKFAKGQSGAGDLEAQYDEAGNLTDMVVRRSGQCLPAGASCWQRFAYEWDESNRLVQARRWDLQESNPSERTTLASLASPLPGRNPDVELSYAYNASDDRTLKTAIDQSGAASHTIYIFDSLELRRARWEAGDYELSSETEVPYLVANGARLGRVKFFSGGVPEASSGKTHVFLELGDHLGSTETVLDKDTGELVEQSTYQAYGATESDYRPDRWQSFREDYKFTGKEEDIEVGLQYFGKRYYAPALNRWISADPLTIHSLGADLNVYAYVHGRTFATVDPNGTCEIICAMMITGAVIGAALGAGQSVVAQWGSPGGIDLMEVGINALAGAAGGAVAPLGGPGLSGAMMGGVYAFVTSGVLARTGLTHYRGGSVGDAVVAGLNPGAMASDALMGGAAGGIGYGIAKGVPAIRAALRSQQSPSAVAPSGGGGPSGAAPVSEPPPTVAQSRGRVSGEILDVLVEPSASPQTASAQASPPKPAPPLRAAPRPAGVAPKPPAPERMGRWNAEEHRWEWIAPSKVQNNAKSVNGNSLQSSSPQHVYEILRTDAQGNTEVYKFGISGGQTRNGVSVRAETQVRRLNAQAQGRFTYESQIVTQIPGGPGARAQALAIERNLVYQHKALIRAKPPGNLRP